MTALKKLYKGSLSDMQFRTPDIGSLNCLFMASRERFVRNMSFVRHLLLCPESPAVDDAARPDTQLACFEKCRAMCHREYAEHLLQPRGSGLASLSIPFEIVDQDWSQVSDLLLPPTVEFLAINNYYCKVLTASSSYSRGLATPTVSLQVIVSLCFDTMLTPNRIGSQTLKLSPSTNQTVTMESMNLLKSCDLELFHIEDRPSFGSPTESDNAELVTTQLLPCLRRQLNLRALALNIPCCGLILGSETSAREE
jgi:hypothetical protein